MPSYKQDEYGAWYEQGPDGTWKWLPNGPPRNPGAIGRPAPRTVNANGTPRPTAQAPLTPQQELDSLARGRLAQSDAFWQQQQAAQQNAANNAAFNSWLEQGALAQRGQQRETQIDEYNRIAGQVRTDATAANQRSNDLYDTFLGQQTALNAQDQSTFDRYMQETNPLMTQMRAQGSDPADVQRQLAAYNQAAGIAGGSLDYTAAQYYSNPADVQRQMDSYYDLRGVGQGSLDYTAAQAQAVMAQLAQAQLAQAQTNPEDLARQEWALGEFKGRVGAEVSGEERYLAEMARRKFEADDKSSREAVSANLAARGLRSGGQQIAMQQAAHQQIAGDRLLSELALQANAVGRSERNLGNYAGLSTAMRNAGDNMNMFNTGQENQMNMFNTGEENNVNMFNAGQRNQVSMFNTGQTNQARANNQATRFAGYAGAANQSNAIRSANDQVGMFNTNQTNVAQANNQATRFNGASLQASQSNSIRSANDEMRQFQDIYAQNEAYRVGGLATSRANTGLATTAQIGGRNSELHREGQGVNDVNYGRNQDANRAGWDANTASGDLRQDQYNDLIGWTGRTDARAQTGLQNASNTQVMRSSSPEIERMIRQLQDQNGNATDRQIIDRYGY